MSETAQLMHSPQTSALSVLIRKAYRGESSQPKLLVVGCGPGIEAAVLEQDLDARVIGIDIAGNFDDRAAKVATLQIGDAMAMDSADDTFDIVYSFHALEHITNPHRASSEMRRVLRPSGLLCIGTPNRRRIVG